MTNDNPKNDHLVIYALALVDRLNRITRRGRATLDDAQDFFDAAAVLQARPSPAGSTSEQRLNVYDAVLHAFAAQCRLLGEDESVLLVDTLDDAIQEAIFQCRMTLSKLEVKPGHATGDK